MKTPTNPKIAAALSQLADAVEAAASSIKFSGVPPIGCEAKMLIALCRLLLAAAEDEIA